jgi:predicted nuclease of restriction endonuclease-like RecB superfamily
VKKNQYKNLFEATVAKQIKRSKVKFEYEPERIPFVIASHYRPDFVLSTALGKVYIECKGYFRPEDKRKLLAVKRQNPKYDIRILFYSHRPSYIKWAEKNGFKWAVEKIPREWFSGL